MKKPSTDRNERKPDKFLQTITTIFSLSRWFGIPVYGDKKFLLLTIIILSMMIIIEIMAITKLIQAHAGNTRNLSDDRGVTARLSGAVFYVNSILSLLISWRFIKTWKKLLSKSWLLTESNAGLYIPPEKNIKIRIIFVSCFVMFCGCVEHLLSMLAATGFDCPLSEYISRYVLSSHKFMIQLHEYNEWVGMLIFIMSNIATILWNFQDLIVIVTSMGLASRYHRLNLFVKEFVTLQKHGRHSRKYRLNLLTSVQTWRQVRIAYVQQADLVRKVEKHLGVLLFLCNVNNFFFICLQLFLGLRKSEGSTINRVYYFVSLGWLMFRACSVVLAAADVNLHSQMALTTLCECPSSRFNVEVKRLKYQLINDEIVLSAMGLFFLNRHMLLEVGAAIKKYELILIQFDK